MRLRIYPSEGRARVMREEVRELLSGERRLVIVAYDPKSMDLLKDLIGERKDVTVISSFSHELISSLFILLASLRGGEACLVDEMLGAYLRASSSSLRPYDLQRAFIILMGLVRSFEKQLGSLVSVHTTETEVPEWFLRLFDAVEVVEWS